MFASRTNERYWRDERLHSGFIGKMCDSPGYSTRPKSINRLLVLLRNQLLVKLSSVNMDKKLILSKATVDYDVDTNLFCFSKHEETTKIKINPYCMIRLIQGLTETENIMATECEGPDRTVYFKDLQENNRVKINLELTVFNCNWYLFLKQYYIPSRDVTGALSDDGVAGPEEVPARTEDERVLAFKSALKMRLESAPKKSWVPVKGSVQLCPRDFNSLIEYATAMVQKS